MICDEYREIRKYDIPSDGMYRIVTDCFWLISEDGFPLVWHSKRGGFGLQCNKCEEIIRSLCGGKPYRKFPIVFVPISVAEYEIKMGR